MAGTFPELGVVFCGCDTVIGYGAGVVSAVVAVVCDLPLVAFGISCGGCRKERDDRQYHDGYSYHCEYRFGLSVHGRFPIRHDSPPSVAVRT